MARCWYAYNGSGDPTLAANYSLAGVTPGCLTGSVICVINAPCAGSTPSAPLSIRLRRYIAAALITGIPQPQDSFVFALFVYLKNS